MAVMGVAPRRVMITMKINNWIREFVYNGPNAEEN
jgi:hypothetical protein